MNVVEARIEMFRKDKNTTSGNPTWSIRIEGVWTRVKPDAQITYEMDASHAGRLARVAFDEGQIVGYELDDGSGVWEMPESKVGSDA